MNIKSQAQAQYQYAMSHKGKAIGSALGIVAGVSYGLAGKQSNWATVGLAIGGAVAGAILGGMFDKTPSAVVVTNGNGGAKAPVVDNTENQDIANDTAGDDGMMNAAGLPDIVDCTNPYSLSKRGRADDECCVGTKKCRGFGIKNEGSAARRKLARR